MGFGKVARNLMPPILVPSADLGSSLGNIFTKIPCYPANMVHLTRL